MLVVQADAFNRSRIATIACVALTSSLALAPAPGNVRVSARASRLPRASVANVTQVVTLDRSYLRERVGRLPAQLLSRVDEGLKLVLDL